MFLRDFAQSYDSDTYKRLCFAVYILGFLLAIALSTFEWREFPMICKREEFTFSTGSGVECWGGMYIHMESTRGTAYTRFSRTFPFRFIRFRYFVYFRFSLGNKDSMVLASFAGSG